MSLVRCYLPLTVEELRALQEHRALTGDREAYAVTESVRRSDPGGDDESWEWAAMQDAARHQLAAGAPVLVAAVDIERGQVDDHTPAGSRVAVSGTITLPRVAALHAGDDVTAPGSPRPGADEEIELSWFDTTELDHLVGLAQDAVG